MAIKRLGDLMKDVLIRLSPAKSQEIVEGIAPMVTFGDTVNKYKDRIDFHSDGAVTDKATGECYEDFDLWLADHKEE